MALCVFLCVSLSIFLSFSCVPIVFHPFTWFEKWYASLRNATDDVSFEGKFIITTTATTNITTRCSHQTHRKIVWRFSSSFCRRRRHRYCSHVQRQRHRDDDSLEFVPNVWVLCVFARSFGIKLIQLLFLTFFSTSSFCSFTLPCLFRQSRECLIWIG